MAIEASTKVENEMERMWSDEGFLDIIGEKDVDMTLMSWDAQQALRYT